MKHVLLALILVGMAVPAIANQATVKASLYRIDLNLRLYEICGDVAGIANPAPVDITVDPGTKFEGHYMTSSSANGAFCQIIRVLGNAVNVEVLGTKLGITQATSR